MDSLQKLEQAARRGNGEAQLACARAYTEIAIRKRLVFCSVPAGSPALRGPARHLETGGTEQEIARDFRIAFFWYQKAAEQGIVDALYELSLCYEEGEGTAPYPKKAQRLLEEAAELGHVQAQFRLAMQYYEGDCAIGLKQDYKEAAYWLEKAAEQDDNFAQYYLGLCYQNGEGVERDYEKAVSLFRRAADREYPQAEAIFELGRCYEEGLGVPKDMTLAVRTYEKAAQEGDMRAAYRLGECYEHGRGVKKELSRALEWYSRAAEEDDEDAIAALCRLNK